MTAVWQRRRALPLWLQNGAVREELAPVWFLRVLIGLSEEAISNL